MIKRGSKNWLILVKYWQKPIKRTNYYDDFIITTKFISIIDKELNRLKRRKRWLTLTIL